MSIVNGAGTTSTQLATLVIFGGMCAAALANVCWQLTDEGWGCDNGGATLNPGECILDTTVNILQNGIEPATGPGRTQSSGAFDLVCEQTIGVLDGSGNCVPPQGGTITHQGFGNDQSLSGGFCNLQPGGGGG